MTRRKGERPVPKRLVVLTPDSPVRRSIAEGDHWFDAWVAEASTPWARLARDTGIPMRRFVAIRDGDRMSRTELDALARAWSVSSGDLLSTLPDRSLVVD
jgi:hypothetical protein